MRLFVATDLDAAAREEIAALQWRLVRRVPDQSSLKWTKPDQMHLTLVFIGEADEALTAKLIVAMQPAAPVITATCPLIESILTAPEGRQLAMCRGPAPRWFHR